MNGPGAEGMAVLPLWKNTPGNIRPHGDYCAVICDYNEVSEDDISKIIDVGSGTPTLVAFDQNPEAPVKQVAVDTWTAKVVVGANSYPRAYNIAKPTAAPTTCERPRTTPPPCPN